MYREKKSIGMTEAIKRIGISPERLRYWETKGIVSPKYVTIEAKRVRRYSEEDVEIGIEIRNMIEHEGFTLKGAAQRLNRSYKGA